MLFKYINKNIIAFVRVLSVVLISSAVGLELANIYATLTDTVMPNIPILVFWIGRFAMTTHLIEAFVAAFLAPSRNKRPIQYGTYTFFVGTVGLLELFEPQNDLEQLSGDGYDTKIVTNRF
jgi:hypothetical protein